MPPEPRRIVIIQGHPDPSATHFGHALARAYAEGASQSSHAVSVIDIARLDFPLLRSGEELRSDAVPPAIREAQAAISRADHLVLIYPVWNGAMPALLKGFLEQTFRPRFMFGGSKGPTGFFSALWHKKALKGKTARVVVTMAMPGFVYRWFFHPHPERNTLRLSGIRSIRESFVGLVEGRNSTRRERWLGRMYALGLAGR
jgi:putative NADPH-quinone reductase